ncbi:MAG: tyrosine-type recombinase/integrase [Actinomycetota bacterium]|nr:tyrosine-type recombinase/integrase [Actinomycetota bacterium]
MRFRRRAPKRTHLTEREAGRLLAGAEREAKEAKAAGAGARDARARRAAEARRLRALRDHAAISAMLYAGLRIEEASGLTLGDLLFDDAGDDEVLVRGKGGKERRVPMHPKKLKASLRRLISAQGREDSAEDAPLFRNDRGGRITESSVRRRLYRYVREARLRKEDLTPHDLRRTFATWYLAENPEGLRDLAELLGHSDLTQVMKYALSDEKRARAGVRRIGEGAGPVADAEAATVPLGESWWVLDNALGLGRELGEKKGRELRLLSQLKVSYPGFPEGLVLARETPDFVAESPGGRKVGLELVEAYRGGGRRKGSRHREREGSEEGVLRLDEDLYYAEGHPGPVHAYLTWHPENDRGRGPLPLPARELAGAIVRIVREGAPVWASGGRLELGPPELEGTPLAGVLYGLSARRTGFVGADRRDSPWGRSLSYAREAARIEDLADAVSSKDRVYEGCRKACHEAWFVVALTGGPSSFDDAEDTVLGHPFRSPFDRVLLLCQGAGSAGRRVVALGRA